MAYYPPNYGQQAAAHLYADATKAPFAQAQHAGQAQIPSAQYYQQQQAALLAQQQAQHQQQQRNFSSYPDMQSQLPYQAQLQSQFPSAAHGFNPSQLSHAQQQAFHHQQQQQQQFHAQQQQQQQQMHLQPQQAQHPQPSQSHMYQTPPHHSSQPQQQQQQQHPQYPPNPPQYAGFDSDRASMPPPSTMSGTMAPQNMIAAGGATMQAGMSQRTPQAYHAAAVRHSSSTFA